MATRLKLVCHASTSAVRTYAFPADEPIDLQGRRRLAAVSHGLAHAKSLLDKPEPAHPADR